MGYARYLYYINHKSIQAIINNNYSNLLFFIIFSQLRLKIFYWKVSAIEELFSRAAWIPAGTIHLAIMRGVLA